VSLDVQGLLRKVEKEKVIPIDWTAQKDILPHIHFLKANEEEMKVLTGTDDAERAAKQLADWGVSEVVITLGSKGSLVYHRNCSYHIKAYQPRHIADATGCGDTYMAGYLFKRVNGAGIQEAGEFAAAMASLKLAAPGPFTGSGNDIRQVIHLH
jgi:sugar/nucleoside kinase (ribokinase family)